MTPKIAIIGAGPGGLTLARILHQNGIPTTIYDKETSPEMRSALGGILDLHEGTGQLALRKAGLHDQFQKLSNYDAEDFVLADHLGQKHIDVKETERGRPEIDRSTLRKLLLDSLPIECIKWNHKVLKVEQGTLHFDGHSESGFDLIIGADGAWSKVRQFLSYVSPSYSGITGVEIRLRDVDRKYPDLSNLVGRGSYFAFGGEEGRCLMAQRQGDKSIRIYAFQRKPEDWAKGVDFENSDEARAALLHDYQTWSPKHRKLLEVCDDGLVPRVLYMLPIGVRWPHKQGLTLIGDSAHLMTPFAGEGVNSALHDALDLAEALLQSPDDLDLAVKNYEKVKLPRSEKTQKKTYDYLNYTFTEDGIPKYKEEWTTALSG